MDVLLTEWQEALKEQSRKKELTAHIIEQQKIVVSEAVEALEKGDADLEKARFTLAQAQTAYEKVLADLNSLPDHGPQAMHARLDTLNEKRNEHLEAVKAAQVKVTNLQKKLDKAKTDLAFDEDQHGKILTEWSQIAARVETLLKEHA